MSSPSPKHIKKMIAQNKRAYYDYFIEESFEAGIVLTGTEVKSLRKGQASIAESHAEDIDGEFFLLGSHILEYSEANRFNHSPRRPRKLLLHAKEIRKLIGSIRKKGMTLVPISLYFTHKNLVKISLGLAKGKKQHDKRQALKEKEWQRNKQRLE